jgi:hypothetical protein
MSDQQEWYWCLDHSVVEPGDRVCPPDRRMGPYSSPEEARNWKGRLASREEAWKAEDRRWEGED